MVVISFFSVVYAVMMATAATKTANVNCQNKLLFASANFNEPFKGNYSESAQLLMFELINDRCVINVRYNGTSRALSIFMNRTRFVYRFVLFAT